VSKNILFCSGEPHLPSVRRERKKRKEKKKKKKKKNKSGFSCNATREKKKKDRNCLTNPLDMLLPDTYYLERRAERRTEEKHKRLQNSHKRQIEFPPVDQGKTRKIPTPPMCPPSSSSASSNVE
jgi:hypothetical protein